MPKALAKILLNNPDFYSDTEITEDYHSTFIRDNFQL